MANPSACPDSGCVVYRVIAQDYGLAATTTWYVLQAPSSVTDYMYVRVYDVTQSLWACDVDTSKPAAMVWQAMSKGYYSQGCKTSGQTYVNGGDTLEIQFWFFGDPAGNTSPHLPLAMGGDGFVASSTTVLPWVWIGGVDNPFLGLYHESQTGAFQTAQQAINAALASTTSNLANVCSPFSSGFSFADCLTATIWPGSASINDDMVILKNTAPLGYIFRLIDIVSTTTASTSMPQISYTFASTSPFAGVNIHYDPFGSIAEAGTLVNSIHSDQSGKNVWDILMPVVNIFIYLVLFSMIIHDLTGVYSEMQSQRGENKSKIK